MEVGHISARLDAIFQEGGFDRFDRRYERAQAEARNEVKAKLGADFDDRNLDRYSRALARARAEATHREHFKAKLGADFDESAFKQFERSLTNVTAAGEEAGNVFGGGGGLSAGIGALRGAIGPMATAAAAAAPLLVALAGAATALAGSLAAAAAGAGAIGIGIGAALGPLAALAGAVVQRVNVIGEAYKALGVQQTKGADQGKAAAQAQTAAADQVKGAEQSLADAQRNVQTAQENLTTARFRARRELQDLAAAADHTALAERRADLSLQEALKRLAAVEADPRSARLDVEDARLTVREAQEGLKNARTERSRAQTDAKRGTDTAKRAEEQLAAARRGAARAADQVKQAQAASAAATEKQGAAATDAQEKLAKLSKTERGLLTTFRRTADAFRKTFQPATDAIFGGVDDALQRLTPVMERFRGRFKGIGDAISGITTRAARSLAGPEWGRALDSFVDTARKIVKPVGESVGSVLIILRNIAVAAQPLVVDLARGIRDFLGELAGKTRDAGRMRDLIRDLAGHTRDWVRFAGAVGRLMITIFSGGARDGQSLLTTLTRVVNRWNAFLSTQRGQREMRQFFKDSVQITRNLAEALGILARVFGPVVIGINRVVSALGRFLESGNILARVIRTWVTRFYQMVTPLLTLYRLVGGQLGDAFHDFAHAVGVAFGSATDVILGFVTTGLGAIEKLAGVASHIPGVGGKFKDLQNAIKDARGSLDDYRESLRDTGREHDRVDLSKVRRENRQTAKTFDDLAHDGKASMTDISGAVATNTRRIKTRLGNDSAAGKQALAENFEQAIDAVRRQMRRGEIATRDGMKAIRGYLVDELRVYGLSLRQARNVAATGDVDANRGREGGATRARGGRTYAAGGWIGAPGMVGPDSIAMDASVGGSILNRHQIPVADIALHLAGHGGIGGLLARGGHTAGPTTRIVAAPGELHFDPIQTGVLDRALAGAGIGGLDTLFARVNTPHFMARGGGIPIVPVPGFPGERANRSILDEIAWVHRVFGLTLTDAYGAGHKSPGHTVTGTAADFAGPDRKMDAAVRALVRAGYLVGYDGRFGSRNWPGHGPSTVAGANAHLHVEFGTKGGALTDAMPTIPRVEIRGGGAVGRAAQRGVELGRRGARRLLNAAGSTGFPDTPASSSETANMSLARKMMLAARWAADQWRSLKQLWTGESNFDEHASNPKGGDPAKVAYGIPQALPGAKMASAGPDWRTNPATQIGWGLGYIRQRYGSPAHALSQWLSRSPHWYAAGGRVGRKAIKSLERRLNAPRAAAWDTIMDDKTGSVARLARAYTLAERRYNLTDEGDFLNEDGTLDETAIRQRAKELFGLAIIRGQIIEQLQRARVVALRIIATYKTVIGRLRASRRFSKEKDRRGIDNDITANEANLRTWQDNLTDAIDPDLADARIDRLELANEYATVTGTQPRLPDAGDTADTSDAAQAAPSPADIAAAAIAQFKSFQAGRVDLLRNFGDNFAGNRQRYTDTDLTAAAGRQFFGAGEIGHAGGGPVINQTIQFVGGPPADEHTFSRGVAHEIRAALA